MGHATGDDLFVGPLRSNVSGSGGRNGLWWYRFEYLMEKSSPQFQYAVEPLNFSCCSEPDSR